MASMRRRGRPGQSDAQKAELRQRWKDGQSLSDIGRALSKHAARFMVSLLHAGELDQTHVDVRV